ncbi:BTAD domain-containing putative transcriptional regulator [Streptomyces sp. NPDC052225]|uniref:BTAD domain-containing putative transcriptional regulator n=1 Tax=Streptomyces sp. NPDC052225 TaxID=3154949 RepID=UPI0034428C21
MSEENEAVTFGVLGPLVAADARGPLALKGPRHRAVLARLLVAKGRVVPASRLVDDLWEEPPARALGALRTFVSDLRRALEPGRAARQPARLLVTVGPGYALRTEDGAVDADRFEAAVTAAGQDLGDATAAGRALTSLDAALALWRGPAYAECADEPWARAEAERLAELRRLALERRARALLALGRAADAVPDLEVHTAASPWREDAWRLLALALYRTGRQGEALNVLRRARRVLADDLGLDPGPALRRLETEVLAQSAHLLPPTRAVPELVGRDAELAALQGAADDAKGASHRSVALVTGIAGAGRTALLRETARRLAEQGWRVARGPWPEIFATLGVPDPLTADGGSGPHVDPVAARARAHRAAVSSLADAAAAAPLLLLLDDLHEAGEETHGLLAAVLGENARAAFEGRAVLVVAACRDTAADADPLLAATLARLARTDPVRVALSGLDEAAVGALVRATAGPRTHVPDATARTVWRRSAGNPFYVKELAHLVARHGPDAPESAVPDGVRDVVRARLDGLVRDHRTVLHQAAVLTGPGSDALAVDAEVLAELTGLDGPSLTDALEAGLGLGFLEERPGLRFAHALVRDTLYEDVSGPRRAQWHAAAGAALERVRPDAVEALARHFLAAGTRATALPGARYAAAAAERAEHRFAPHEAERLWAAALSAYDRAGEDHPRTRLRLLMGRARALAVTGRLPEARAARAQALTAAETLGDPQLTASVLTAFDVPANWPRNDDEDLSARIASATERTLAALKDAPASVRSRLLSTLALELRGTAGPRGAEAAREAVALARPLADPALLALALNARWLHTFHRTGLSPERAAIGRELVDLGARHDLVTYEVLGHLVLLQSACALARFDEADRHAAAADRLGDRYELPVVGAFTAAYTALRAAVRAEASAGAELAEALARLEASGMPGVTDGLAAFARFSLMPRHAPAPDADFGPYDPWVRPATHRAGAPVSPHDLFHEARLCLAARGAIEAGDTETAASLHTELLPAEGELAGAGSGLCAFGPVALDLGDLDAFLGRPDAARAHWRRALALARQAGAPAWEAEVRARLRRTVLRTS